MKMSIILQKNWNSILVSDKKQNLIALLFLLFFLIINTLSVQGRDLTFDEPRHYLYGENVLNGDSTRFDDSKMPVSAWNALPAKVAEYLSEGIFKTLLTKKITARLMTTLFSMMTALVVFHWARKLYGFIPALVSLVLYVFDPNMIAHSQLITTDIYAAGSILISSYWLWKFAGSRKWQDGLWCAVTLGLAQLTKYTALSLYLLFAVALLVYDWQSLKKTFDSGIKVKLIQQGWRYFIYAIIAGFVGILIINIGFLFNRTFISFSEYQFRSELFESIQSKVSFIVPTPYPYLEGLDWVIQRERTGQGYGRIYLLGSLQNEGFLGYYLIASLFKVPIAAQILMITAFAVYAFDKKRRQLFGSKEIFLLLPVLFYTIYFNFFYNAQIGIRYYLVVFPLLYVFTGSLFSNWVRFLYWQKILTVGLISYLVISVLSYYPYYITYFNELIWDKTQTYKILADSNLDWGQSRREGEKYFSEHSYAKTPTAKPQSGQFVVSANRLVGIATDPLRFAWLRENFEPVDLVANYYLIYNISQDEIINLCQTTNYCK